MTSSSVKGIIGVSDLEKDGVDYSAISSTYTDDVLCEWISEAEIFVCNYMGISYDSTASDVIKYIVKMIARQIALNHLIIDGFIKDQIIKDPKNMQSVITMLDNLQDGTDYTNSSVVRINMRGYNEGDYY